MEDEAVLSLRPAAIYTSEARETFSRVTKKYATIRPSSAVGPFYLLTEIDTAVPDKA